MELIKTKQRLSEFEKKSEINIEDVLSIITELGQDLDLMGLPAADCNQLVSNLRKLGNLLKLLVDKHRDQLITEKGFSRLEKICMFLEDWEREMAAQEHQGQEDVLDMIQDLSEYESREEKLLACMKMQSAFRKHGELFEKMKSELEYKERELVIDMLQTEDTESMS
ncbi:MAG: hypothetical protein PUG60_07270 [Lachnospiraceae bacterium]|nr:hypothetical protein [Lachnospiraceae bacterium]MDY4970448.1 hypothetical protein [Lachnospiraceae bacterium]